MSTPRPGIYEDVPFEDYLAWDAVSNSSLRAAEKSPLHWLEQQPIKPTEAMQIGSFLHSGRLEPSRLLERYVVQPNFYQQVLEMVDDKTGKPKYKPSGVTRTNTYQNLVNEFAEQAKREGKEVVEQPWLDDLQGVLASIRSNDRATSYLETPRAKIEVSIIWQDKDTGVLCKARLDHWAPEQARVTDLKSTDDISDFGRKIGNWSYHRQLAFYGDGLQELGHPVVERCIVAVERKKPYGVMAAPLCAADIIDGRASYKQLLESLAACQESGEFRGYENPDQWERRVYGPRSCELVLSDGEIIQVGGVEQ